MKILIAEDDLASRKFIYKFMSQYGQCDITVDGMEALDAYLIALDENQPYDLICLDIMMPKVDGIKALKTIRKLEEQRNICNGEKCKIIMTTALNEVELVKSTLETGCEAYVSKPIDTKKLAILMDKLNFINKSDRIK